MSAYLCSPVHLSAIITARAYLRANGRPVDWQDPIVMADAKRAFKTLAEANAASVDALYTRGPRAADSLEMYAFAPIAWPFNPHANLITGSSLTPAQRKLLARVINACRCYAYQACEHAGWDTSDARSIVNDVMRSAADAIARSLDDSWAVTDAGHFVAA